MKITDELGWTSEEWLCWLICRYQFFLQLKLDILSGRLLCEFDTCVELAAYVVQCMCSTQWHLSHLSLDTSLLLSVCLCLSNNNNNNNNDKKRSERRKHCTLAVGCRKAEPKKFTPPQTPFPGVQDGQNLISWRRSLPLPIDPVWWGLMHAISSYRANRPTNTQTNKPTDRTDYNTLCCS